MEPEGSLQHSQVPANTYTYPEPDRSSPRPASHFLKIHLNIILPSTSGSPQWSLSSKFPHQNPIHTSALLYSCYMPAHPILDLITRTMFREQYRSLSSSLCSFLHSPVHSSLLGPNILLNTRSLCSYLNQKDQVSHPYKTTDYYYLSLINTSFNIGRTVIVFLKHT